MASIKVVEGDCGAAGGRFAVVAARWNGAVVEGLKQGALAALRRHGVGDERIAVIHVPGAFEIPLAARVAARSGDYAAVIALGAVIRGATAHFDYVAGECLRGLSKVMEDCGVPVGCGVLTVDTLEQALERSRAPSADESALPASARSKSASATGIQNRGEEAALAALEMASLLGRFPAPK